MGKTKLTRKESAVAQICVIFSLIVCVHLVTSQGLDEGATAEAPPCPPSSSSSSSVDLHPVSDMMGDGEVGTAKLTEAVVLAFLTSRKDEGTRWEILVILVVFPSAVWAIFLCENPLRNMYPRFANVLELLFGIFFVNGVIAFHLPEDYYWVPAVSFVSSLLALIIASCRGWLL